MLLEPEFPAHGGIIRTQMPQSFHLAVVAPDRSVVELEVVSIVAPGQEGYFGTLANHVPFVAALKAGLLEYELPDGQRQFVALGGGFFEMDGKRATVLADSADLASEIDVAKAQQDLEMARAALKGESSEMTAEEAQRAIDVAISRLRAAQTKH